MSRENNMPARYAELKCTPEQIAEVEETFARADKAQKEFESWSQEAIDRTIQSVAQMVANSKAFHELVELGILVESTIEHNVTRSVYFHDPDGNRVELYCDMVERGFEAMQTLGPRRDVMDIETGEVVSR